MSKLFKPIFFFITLYFYFFSPAFTVLKGINSIMLLYPLIVVAILKKKELRNITSYFKEEYGVLILLLVYVVFLTLIGGELTFLYQQILAMMNVFYLPLCIILLCDSFRINQQWFFRYILFVCATAALISCLCLILPSLNEFVRFSLLAEEEDMYLQTHMYRGFGIANSLTSGYASALSVIMCFGFFWGEENKWFYLFAPFIVVAILVNARTAFIVLCLGIILFLYEKKSFGSFFAVCASVGLILLFVTIIIRRLDTSEGTINWVLSFFEEITEILSGNSLAGSTAGVLIENHVFFPDKLSDWIFGTGENLFHGTERRSDVGFIRQLFSGGLIFLLLEFFLVMIICLKSRSIMFRGFTSLFLVSIAVFHTKGIFVPSSAGFRVFMLVYYYVYYREVAIEKAVQKQDCNRIYK